MENCVDDILTFGKNESKYIKRNIMGSRSGQAGGLVYPDTNSASLCSATKTKDSILLPRKVSLGCSVYYDNDGEKKSFNSIFNRIKMQRLKSREKKKYVLESHVQQRVLLAEMKSRFTSMLILEKNNHLSCSDLEFHIVKLKEVLRNQDLIDQFRKMNYSYFHSFLLAWGVSTGAMHNHEALCAHKDSNKSHPVETMTIYPRIPDSKDVLRDRSYNIVPGYLTFPLYGFNLELKCGSEALHCSLRDTVHLPDHSRSISNWSKVHGP